MPTYSNNEETIVPPLPSFTDLDGQTDSPLATSSNDANLTLHAASPIATQLQTVADAGQLETEQALAEEFVLQVMNGVNPNSIFQSSLTRYTITPETRSLTGSSGLFSVSPQLNRTEEIEEITEVMQPTTLI